MSSLKPYNLITLPSASPTSTSAIISGSFFLMANLTTTTVSAPGCLPTSVMPAPCPTTPDAANDMATTSYAMGTNQFTVTHASNARTDRSFNFVIFI